MPDGTTQNTQLASNSAASTVERPKTYQRFSGHGHARHPDLVKSLESEWALIAD